MHVTHRIRRICISDGRLFANDRTMDSFMGCARLPSGGDRRLTTGPPGRDCRTSDGPNDARYTPPIPHPKTGKRSAQKGRRAGWRTPLGRPVVD